MLRAIVLTIAVGCILVSGCERREANNPLDPGNSSPPAVSLSWPVQTQDTVAYFPVRSEITGYLELMETDVSILAFLVCLSDSVANPDTLQLINREIAPGDFVVPFEVPEAFFDEHVVPPVSSQLEICFSDVDGNTASFTSYISGFARVLPQITDFFPNDHFYVIEEEDGSFAELPLRATVSYHPNNALTLSRIEFRLTAESIQDADLIWVTDMDVAGDTLITEFAIPGDQPFFGDYQDTTYVLSIRAIDSANNITCLHPESIRTPDRSVEIHVGPPTKELNIYLPVEDQYIGRSFELVFADQLDACEDPAYCHSLLLLWESGEELFELAYDSLYLLQQHTLEIPDANAVSYELSLSRHSDTTFTVNVPNVLVDTSPPEFHNHSDTLYLNGPETLSFLLSDEQSGLSPLNCYASLLDTAGNQFADQRYEAFFENLQEGMLLVEFDFSADRLVGLEALLQIVFQDVVNNADTVDLSVHYRTSAPEVVQAGMDPAGEILVLALNGEFIPVDNDSVYVGFQTVPGQFLMAHDSTTAGVSWFSINPYDHYVSGDTVEVDFSYQDIAGNAEEYSTSIAIDTFVEGLYIEDFSPDPGSYVNSPLVRFQLNTEVQGSYNYTLDVNNLYQEEGTSSTNVIEFDNLADYLETVNNIHFTITYAGATDEAAFWFVYDTAPPEISCSVEGVPLYEGDTVEVTLGQEVFATFDVTDNIEIPVLGDSLLVVECDGIEGSPYLFVVDDNPSVDCPLNPAPGSEGGTFDLEVTGYDRAGNTQLVAYSYQVRPPLELVIQQIHGEEPLIWYNGSWMHSYIDLTRFEDGRIWFGSIYAADDLQFLHDQAVTDASLMVDGQPVDYTSPEDTVITVEQFGHNYAGPHLLSFAFSDQETGRTISDSTLFGYDLDPLVVEIYGLENSEATFDGSIESWDDSTFTIRIEDMYHFEEDFLDFTWFTIPESVNIDSLGNPDVALIGGAIYYEGCVLPSTFQQDNPFINGDGQFYLHIEFRDYLYNLGSTVITCHYVNMNQ